MTGASHVPAGVLAKQLASLQQSGAPEASAPALTIASTDAELLAAAGRDPRLLVRVSSEAEAAYRAARRAQGCDWRDLDTTWYRFNCDLRRAVSAASEANENSSAQHASRAGALRAALAVRQAFLDKAVPEMSAADRLANQPVPTVVHAHRLSTRGGPHPMEPTLASPLTTEN